MALLRPSLICTKGISISKTTAKQILCIPIVQPKLPNLMFLSEKKTLAEEIGISQPPKKPLSSFIHYLKDNRKNYPDLKSAERIKLIKENWLQLDPSMKAPYIEKFKAQSKEYQIKYAHYLASLTDEQKIQMKALTSSQKNETRIKKALKDYWKVFKAVENIPNHPGGVLSTFYRENKDNERDMLKMVNLWRQLSKKDKNYYSRLYREEINKYHHEIALWEKRMVEIETNHLLN